MSNHSYCNFFNTLIDLEDCIESMEYALEHEINLDAFEKEIGEDEKNASRDLYDACERYIETYKELIWRKI